LFDKQSVGFLSFDELSFDKHSFDLASPASFSFCRLLFRDQPKQLRPIPALVRGPGSDPALAVPAPAVVRQELSGVHILDRQRLGVQDVRSWWGEHSNSL